MAIMHEGFIQLILQRDCDTKAVYSSYSQYMFILHTVIRTKRPHHALGYRIFIQIHTNLSSG